MYRLVDMVLQDMIAVVRYGMVMGVGYEVIYMEGRQVVLFGRKRKWRKWKVRSGR